MSDNGDGSGTSKGKPWERSWSTKEMRQNAHSWNLAGDAGLLKHLQEFSQAVLARTHSTEKSFDLLNEEINTLTSELNNTNNKFLCLANTQFVENRVYDDDDKETPLAEALPEKKSKEETEAKMLQKVREALSMSVAVLDTMFEPVEIQASDSEGESDGDKPGTKTLILEPHNPYIHRPLPHIIGSEQFMSDDHIGLGDTPSDDEDQSLKAGVDHEMETSSESDVDFTPFANSKRDRDIYSSQSSVSDHLGYKERSEKQSKKMKPETAKNVVEDCEESPEPSSSTAQSAQTSNAFAAQLAAKLDKIASPLKKSEQDVQNISAPTRSTSDDLFGAVHSDEEDDGLFTSNSNLFSGRPRLFDDLQDTSNSLWGPEEPKPVESAAPEIKNTEQDFQSQTQNRVTTDLFSSTTTDDEDDLFSIKPSNQPKITTADSKSHIKDVGGISSIISKKHHLKVSEMRPGLATSTPERCHDEESSENNSGLVGNVTQNLTQDAIASDKSTIVHNDPHSKTDNAPQEKKPAGGVLMFGQANILAGLKAKLPRRQSSSSSESSNSDPSEGNSSSLQKSASTLPSVDQPISDTVSGDQGWGSNIGVSQSSQSASLGFASPALTSTRLSNDDGYQTRNALNSVSSIPAANLPDNDSDVDNIFSKKQSVFDSQNPPSLSGGLFAEVNDEEDDLFAVSPVKKVEKEQSKSVLKQSTSQTSLKEDSVPIFVTNETVKTAQPPSPKLSTHNSTKANTERSFLQSDFYSAVPPPIKSESKIKKPVSLFDDSDSGEDEFLFSSASSAGSRRSQASTDILASAAVSSVEKKPLTKKGLFDDDDSLFGSARNDPDVDIFHEPAKSVTANTIVEERKTSSNTNFVKEDSTVSSDADNNSNANGFTKIESVETTKGPSQGGMFQDILFPDDEEDNDDLFSIKSKSDQIGNIAINPPNIEDEEDDLFQNVSVSRPTPKETAQPTSFSNSRPSDASLSSSKPSLIVENRLETDSQKATLTDDTTKVSITVEKHSIIEEPKSTAQSSKKPEPPRTLNIRKETDPALGLLDDSDNDEDLFGSSALQSSVQTSSAPKLPYKPQIASKPEPDFLSKAESVKTTNSKLFDSDSKGKSPGHSEVDGAAVSVSKLKDSLLAGSSGQRALKIDPRAFLPGQKPPPRNTPPKENADRPPVSTVKVPLTNPGSDNAVGFEQPITNSATLPSAHKDRAKLGVKRRPPSNKARREAARASMNLDISDRDSPVSPDVSSAVTDSISAVNNSVISSASVISPSTDEDDLFGVPQDLPPEYGNQTLPSSDIFSGAPILSPLGSAKSEEQSHQDKTRNLISEEEKPSVLEAKTCLFSPPDLGEKSDELFVSEPLSKHVSLPVAEKHNAEENKTEVHPVPSKTTLTAYQALQGTGKDTPDSSGTLTKGNEEVSPEEVISSDVPSTTDVLDTSTIDPLNKVDQSLVSNDDELLQPQNDFDDHSSLFPFVKKKPDHKQSNNQPLFSQTPALPSKGDLSVIKPGLGGLTDVDDDDLFSSSNHSAIGRNTLDTTNKLKGKDKNTWKFSDEDDDDDLFQTGYKTSSAVSSTKSTIPESSSSASPVAPKFSSSTSSKPVVNVKKTKAVQPSSGNGLFSDENDEDDDLFSKPSLFSTKSKPKPVAKSATLFDDDDDDLFGSKSVSTSKALVENSSKDTKGSSSRSEVSKSSKNSNQSVFDDPLMSLGK